VIVLVSVLLALAVSVDATGPAATASTALQPAGTWSAVTAYGAAALTVLLGLLGGLVLPLLAGPVFGS
jgi:NADH-quinone oxidoreductase subunit N